MELIFKSLNEEIQRQFNNNDDLFLKNQITLLKSFDLDQKLLSDSLIKEIKLFNLTNIKILLNLGADPNTKDDREPVLHFACRKNRSDIVELLLDKGALINSKDCYDNTPLHISLNYGSINCIKILLKYNPNPYLMNCYKNSPFSSYAGTNELLDDYIKNYSKIKNFN